MATKRMTWMAAVLGTVALTGMVSCGKGKNANVGAAAVSVNGQKLTLGDVKSVTVTVTGGITNPLTVPLVAGGAQYSALISDLPIGSNYVFTASAYALDGTTVLYTGSVSGQTITKNQTANIVIDMNQVAPTVGIYDEAPVIDGITSTASCVSKNDTVVIKASAHDPDLGDTAHMIWAWTVDNTCGTLSTPINVAGSDNGLPIPPATTPATVYTDGTSTVTFTATSSSASCQVNLSIADARQPAVLMTTGSVTISIGDSCAFGSAKITAIPNTCPVVANLGASVVSPSFVPMVVGQSTLLSVSATDADNDTLLYSWSTTDCATFGNFNSAPGLPTMWFLLTSAPPSGTCTFLVHVSDGTFADGKAKCDIVNHLSLPVKGPGDVVQGNPVFGFDYMSTDTVNDGDSVKLEIVAPNTGCPSPGYTLTWNPAGTALTTLDPPFTTGITLTAAAGAGANGETVTVTATCPSSGVQTVHSFALIGKTAVCNGAADGTDCTSTAQLTDKCVTAAKCATGQCVAQTSITCPASTVACQDNVCGHTTDGLCHLQNSSDGTGCSDGLACTTGDKCAAGVCGGTTKTCDQSGVGQCQVNACVEPNGSCVAGNKPDTTVCNDHNGCTGASNGTVDTCTNGVCGGPDVVCSPSSYVCTSLTDTTHTCAAAVCMSPASYANQWVPAFKGMGVGPDGKVWATGSLLAPFDFGGGTVATYGSSDAFLTQIDPATGKAPAGTSFTFGDGSGKDQAGLGAAVASSGNVGMIGKFIGEIDFTASNSDGSGPSGVPGTAGLDFLQNAASIPFYAVFDGTSTGTYVTPKKAHMVDVGTGALLSIASNPNVNAFAVCGKTSIKVTNWSDTGATKGVIFPVNTATAGGGMDVLVFKVDGTTGAVIWGKQFGGNADQVCESVAVDNNGDVIIAGSYTGTMVLNAGPPVVQLPVQTDTTLGLLYVVKLASGTGAVSAYNTWGTAGVTHPYGLTVDGTTGSTAAGNVIVAGSISANVNFAGTAGTVTSLGLTDAFVAKLDTTLTAIWAKSYGDSGNDQAINTVAASSGGTIYIAGPFAGTMGELGITSSSTTSTDGFTARLNGTTGAMTCANVYGDPIGSQSVTTITVARGATGALADAVMIGGAFTGEMNFGPTSPVIPALDLNTGSPSLSASYMVRLPK